MDRRQFLATGALAALGVGGCAGDPASAPDTAADDPASAAEATPAATATSGDGTPPDGTATPARPGGIYVQTFRERMSRQGTAATDEYAFALMFTVPHTFWTVTGDAFSKTTVEDGDSLHLMATVWDPETRTVLPETGLSVEIAREGSLVSQEVIYPMLSQPMGFHYGGNFGLDGDGTYAVTLSVGGTPVRRTGAFAGRFGDPASVEIPLEFTPATRGAVATRPFDRGGEPGALRPMDASFPQAVAPGESDLTLSTTTVPQVARHEGYERAFRQMDDVSVTL
ncbi:MAG: hypothetical protein V5A44_06370 [Haloarculaceae archaeon]